MRDSFIFYRSFFEAISDLEDKQQLEIYKSISDYSLNFKEPNLSGVSATIFKLIKPQLEANNKRFENGSKPKQKQKVSKTEAKSKQVKSKTEANNNNNVNVNKNDNKNVLSKEELLISYIDDVLLIDLNLVAFKEWIKFKKYNYQKVGITKLVNMLVKYSFDEQQEMVNKSVMNNWSGLFEPKKTFKQNNQASQLTEEDLERFGFNKPSEMSSLGVTPWTE